jgi:solute carrier family 35 (UDP-sugar transporter), member A1/2/3
VIWYSIGGITVAVCLRYTDNIAKDFAIAISILFTTLGSIYFFGFMPNNIFMLGALLVIVSTFLFSKSYVILLQKFKLLQENIVIYRNI